jgi:hypothetical protein
LAAQGWGQHPFDILNRQALALALKAVGLVVHQVGGVVRAAQLAHRHHRDPAVAVSGFDFYGKGGYAARVQHLEGPQRLDFAHRFSALPPLRPAPHKSMPIALVGEG